MRLSAPERYSLTLPRKRFRVREALRGGRFSSRASDPGPKLYVVHVRSGPIYVGVTTQPIANRLRYGWSADGRHGYRGYPWRKAFKTVGLDIWYQEGVTKQKSLDNLETVEAEVVYELRLHGRQWPRFQTEIHFHKSTAAHRRAAQTVLAHCKGKVAHNYRPKPPVVGRLATSRNRRHSHPAA